MAQKFGLQAGYGYRNDPAVAAAPTLESLDGRICPIDAGILPISFSAPLPCLLSNAEKLAPMGMMPTVRIQITLDSVANIFGATAAVAVDAANGVPVALAATTVPTNYVLSGFQLCYTMVDFGPETDAAVRGMGERLYIKSQSFTNSSATVAIGSVGTIELAYSQRLASVKSLFLHASASIVNAAANVIGLNGGFDAFEISNGGDYQFSVPGKYFPPKPISAGDNKSGILMELKKAMGSIYDKTNSFSIDAVEGIRTLAAASTIQSPAKCYIGCNTEMLPSNNVLLSGVSTQSSPITVRINIQAATQTGTLVSLVACFDSIIEVIPSEKSAVVRQ